MYTHQSIDKQDLEYVNKALKGDLITRGPFVQEFEEDLKKTTQASYAVVFNSGSTALEAAYFAAEGGSYDRILTTPNTFVSSLGSGIKRGMSFLFVDIDRDTGNLDLNQALENLDYESTRGRLFFVPVHFSGIAVEMEKFVAKSRNLNGIIIEDAAHALGSYYPSGEPVGSCAYSDMTILSFHPAKTITTGEGGAVLTNDEALFEKLKKFRNNGIIRKSPSNYDVECFTSNYHLTEFQAALGVSQLKRLTAFVEKRRALVKRYRECFKNIEGIRLFTDKYDDKTAFHLFVIQIDQKIFPHNKERLIEKLKEEKVGTQYHYIPLYHFSAVKKLTGDIAPYFPNMEAYFQTALSLPLYYDLALEEVERITTTLIRTLRCFT